jgi:5-methyltetrahydrofolate--homocysteine methyltransferase
LFKNFDLAELETYIDWGPFFQTWDLAGPFPAILKDEVVGAEAQRVFSDGKRMLKRLVEGRWLQAHGVVGLYPANSVGDDIVLWTDETRTQAALTWHGLRQQTEKPVHDGVQNPNRCLSDFVAPLTDANGQATGYQDYVGMFAVTSGMGVDAKEKYFMDDHDDYSAIMLKALADRFAEAFAECMHERVRKDLWGYAPTENASLDDLIAEKYQGIRPAPGYPACPDHSVKKQMFELLQCDEIGMGLTESLAMTPAASVSGFYISHPNSQYFNVGKVSEDQVQDLAKRQNLNVSDIQRLLAPNL